MAIDWLTVAAQIVNFLVLVWLLQRFLYRPIVTAMDRREQRIAERLAEAKRKSDEADREADRLRAEREQLAACRDQTLNEVREEAEHLRVSMLDEIRKEIEEKKKKWSSQIDEEQQNFFQELRQKAGQQIFAVTRRVFRDMANADVERLMTQLFVERMQSLNKEQKKRLKDAVADGYAAAVVRSAFEVPASLRRRLTKVIHDEIGGGIDVVYQASEEIGCGIELRAGSQVVSWSLDGYLDAMEAHLTQLVRDRTLIREAKPAG